MISTVLIVVVIFVVLVVGVSLALGRSTYEVDSARDTEYLELEGTWVHYSVVGGGPPVVLVHGWLSSSMVWENLAGRLAQRFTVYTLDLTGFGESDKPLSGYGVRYGSRLIYAFCAHFGLTRASIIGHDLGGNMAVKLAADHPDVAGRLVLVATPANEEQIDLPTPLWAATLPVIGPIFYMLGRAARPVRAMWMKPFVSEAEDLTEDVIEDAARSTPAAMSQTLSVSKREIGGGRLARQARIIKVPVLVVAGEEDQIVDPQSAGVWARSLVQADVCLMDECGHMPMIERVGEFNAQILAFLTGDARYLEYVERVSDEKVEDGEGAIANGEDEDADDTASFDTKEVRMDPGPSEDRREEREESRRFGVDNEEEDDEAPAFGPPPGEEDDFRRRLEEDSRPSTTGDSSEEEIRAEEIRAEDTREKRIREKLLREDEIRRSEARRDEARGEEPRGDDADDDAPPPVVRRIGDRLSGRRRRRGEFEEEEPPDLSTEDETSELDPPQEEPLDEKPSTSTPPSSPPPRRRRPRRETSDSDADSGGDIVPEVPSDLFNWGETWDEDIKRPRERPPRRSRRSESEGHDDNGGDSDSGEGNSNGTSDGSPGEPPRI